MSEELETSSGESPRKKAILPIALVSAAIFGGLALVGTVAILLLRGNDGGNTEAIAPTPFSVLQTEQQPQELVNVRVGSGEEVALTLDAPSTLTLGGYQFAVQADRPIAGQAWQPTFGADTTAAWVYGSVVNYVFAVLDTQENRAMAESLIQGEPIILHAQSGSSFEFSFSSREVISQNNQDVFAQTKPGITILFVGAGNVDDTAAPQSRLVVHGRYVPPDASQIGGGTQATVLELGETTQLGDLQVTVTGSSHLFDRAEAPPGFDFLLVDFSLENTGQLASSAETLHISLLDDLGNQYAVSSIAAQLGNFRSASGLVTPGVPIQASSGFQIPSGLSSANLYWRLRADDGQELQVKIPFSGGGKAQRNVQAQLLNADVSVDGTTLTLQGQLTNLDEQAVVVSESDLSLTSNGTVYLMVATNPGFPWVLQPGQALPFSVSFQRPAGTAEAVFTVLEQPWQLQGLQ